ncbi:MAG: translation initiation factor IF-2 associated domain-containing protein, partial [Caulobacter sp.]|nr:translation initiation factor IF-2 associated domain-containing protein [Caulobacter sp.]
MSDDNENRPGRPPMTLKPRTGSVSAGVVKQSFSHGRSKTVVVETKRARPHVAPQTNLAGPSSSERNRPPAGGSQRPSPSGAGGLSAEEMRARQQAIESAQQQARAQALARAQEEARQKAAAEAAAAEA